MSFMSFASVLALIEAATPDGRWSLLQSWLKATPEWKGKVDRWLVISPDDAVAELEAAIREQFKLPVMFMDKIITEEMKVKAKAAIETLQACYKERANQSQPEQQKEKKNVRTRMDNGCEKKRAVGKRSKKSHR